MVRFQWIDKPISHIVEVRIYLNDMSNEEAVQALQWINSGLKQDKL